MPATRNKSSGTRKKTVGRKKSSTAKRPAKTIRKTMVASAGAKKPARKQDVLVLVGTMKGAFILRSDESRKKWRVTGPHFRGEAVYALLHDTRGGRSRTFAATNSMHWGPSIRSSDDFGETWSVPPRHTLKFPAESGRALAQIWQIAPGRATEPDVLYAGVEPAALFESRDGGENWTPNLGLLNHEHQPMWQPG